MYASQSWVKELVTRLFKKNNEYMLSQTCNYSTEEQVIGTWIDGKPLYQRTFKLDDCPVNSQSVTTIDNYLEIETCVKIFGSAKDVVNANIPLPLAHFQTAYAIYTDIYNQNIRVITSTSSIATNIYVTIQYTKITD